MHRRFGIPAVQLLIRIFFQQALFTALTTHTLALEPAMPPKFVTLSGFVQLKGKCILSEPEVLGLVRGCYSDVIHDSHPRFKGKPYGMSVS